MILKVFTQKNCPKCPAAHQLVEKLRLEPTKLRIEEYDVSTVDGMAEAAYHMVQATPSLILLNDQKKEVGVWLGETPKMEEIMARIN